MRGVCLELRRFGLLGELCGQLALDGVGGDERLGVVLLHDEVSAEITESLVFFAFVPELITDDDVEFSLAALLDRSAELFDLGVDLSRGDFDAGFGGQIHQDVLDNILLGHQIGQLGPGGHLLDIGVLAHPHFQPIDAQVGFFGAQGVTTHFRDGGIEEVGHRVRAGNQCQSKQCNYCGTEQQTHE